LRAFRYINSVVLLARPFLVRAAGGPVNRAVSAAWSVSIMPVFKRKAWHGRSDHVVLEARPKHGTSYLYSDRVGPFGLMCLYAHSVHRVMNNPLIKKIGKYFILAGIFKPTEYDDHNI
jgi:hypothetical protein